jgi:signal peptide peptidase SppA
MVPARDGKNVAVIRAVGTLMKQQSSMGGTSTIQLRRDIRSAAADPTVSASCSAIDSPGGTVAGTADLAADVKAARRKKPVWAHIDDLGASAAYWLASQADAVYANNPTALVGSIGTLQVVYDYSAAAEKEGVKTLVFRTGPLKGAGVPGAAVTEEQAANYQRLVNETQTHFDAAVRAGRGMTRAELDAVRTGGVFPAGEAVGLKLIDGVRPLDATLAALAGAK